MPVATLARAKSITTFTGRRIWPTEITSNDIDPLDIAHALSNLCRYNGHVDQFYSVAQHSCLLHDYGPDDQDVRRQLLLHDATEAYIGDMVAPLKHLDAFEFYRELEDDVAIAIADRFDLPYILNPIVKELDLSIREAEIRDLKKGIGSTNKRRSADKFGQIHSWMPTRARSAMIKRMRALGIKVDEYVK